jgi:hypothetical protein
MDNILYILKVILGCIENTFIKWYTVSSPCGILRETAVVKEVKSKVTTQEAEAEIKWRIKQSRISEAAQWLLLTAINLSDRFTRSVLITVAGWPDETLVSWEIEIWQLFRDDDGTAGESLAWFISRNKVPVTIDAKKVAYRPLSIRTFVAPDEPLGAVRQIYVLGPEVEGVIAMPENIRT